MSVSKTRKKEKKQFRKIYKFFQIHTFDEHFEICSLVGTLTSGGMAHLHTTLGRKDGSTVSGHVVGDMLIFTTAEVVIGNAAGAKFDREMDDETGFDELVVAAKK